MFEKIKENWQKKIERNAIKLNGVTYVTRKGIKLLNRGVPYSQLPEETIVTEDIIIKRSVLPAGDWGIIKPPIKENGKLSLTNLIFGGWRNLIKLIVILTIIGFAFAQYYTDFNTIEALNAANQLCNIVIN